VLESHQAHQPDIRLKRNQYIPNEKNITVAVYFNLFQNSITPPKLILSPLFRLYTKDTIWT
jgi:hypothetical protein